MNNHTCGYKIGFDNELSVGDKTYYVDAEVSVEFDGDVDVQSIEVTKAEIVREDGAPVEFDLCDGRLVSPENAALIADLDAALWRAASEFAADNAFDIAEDLAQ